MDLGVVYAITGAAMAISLGGAGSAFGLRKSGVVVSGILRENPERWGSLFLLAFLPATQGLYGFITAIMAFISVEAGSLTPEAGLEILVACIPIAITGLVTGSLQGSVCAAAAETVAARPDQVGRGVILAAFIEFYAILGLMISILFLI